jgi:hypothetical protein
MFLQFFDEAPFLPKLIQDDGLLDNAVKKLRLWLNFSTAQQCNGNECCGNFTPTSLFIYYCRWEGESPSCPHQLNSYLHPLNGGPLGAWEVNRQIVRTRRMVGHLALGIF